MSPKRGRAGTTGEHAPLGSGHPLRSAVDEQFATALRYHQAGRLDQAKAIYQKICSADPNHAGSLHSLGVLALQVGRPDAAIDLIERALAIRPDDADAHYNLANALRDRGRPDAAAVHYRRALALKPNDAEIHNNLGNALNDQSRPEEALACYLRALELDPNLAEAHNNLGNLLREQGESQKALAHYERVLALKPGLAEAHCNLAHVLNTLGRPEQALQHYRQALRLRPNDAELHISLGNFLAEQAKLEETAACYRRALALAPNLLGVNTKLGNALRALGRWPEAIVCYEREVALSPSSATAHDDLGNGLTEKGKLPEAIACFERALKIAPDFAEARNHLAVALKQMGDFDRAITHYERVLAVKPDYPEARLGLCIAQLPILYRDEAEVGNRRAAYEKHLRALCAELERRPDAGDWAKAIGSSQPFFLAYQGRTDRDLQSLYGTLVCRVMADRYGPAALASPPAPGAPVRVGIVTRFFQSHSVWKLPLQGWLTQLDPRRFQLYGYHTGTNRDQATDTAAAACHRFVSGARSLDRWRETILADALHVLIYPEIGMDAMSARLAAQRLAPVQCNSWGHPDTCGYPTIDYFLSSELMEPPEAQDHYTEHLVRLPNLSTCYEPPHRQPVSLSRPDLGLRPGAVVFWCGQSLFKYLPQYDGVFARIARDVEDCQFVFIEYQHGAVITELFRARLDRAFAAWDLRATDHCIVLPRLDADRFAAANGLCDVVLDSIGWSGGNTTLESLPYDLPIVTTPGTLMRGRHTTAILRMMDVTETIAGTLEEYVAIAVRLARDLPWRMTVRRRMADNRHCVYGDRASIRALEDFLDGVARGVPSHTGLPRSQNFPRSEVR